MNPDETAPQEYDDGPSTPTSDEPRVERTQALESPDLVHLNYSNARPRWIVILGRITHGESQ